MKQVKVGSYRLGNEYVDLYLREGWGADIYFLPEKGRTARIKVGASEGKFKAVLCSLVHELVEFSLDRKSLQYVFVMRHSVRGTQRLQQGPRDEMSDVTAKVGEFIHDCYFDFRRAFHKWKRETKEV